VRSAILGAVAVALAAGGAWGADEYRVRERKDGKQRITTIERVPAGEQKPGEPGAAPADALTMEATNWRCGRAFTDGEQKRWYLVQGEPYSEKPLQVKGQVVKAESGKLYFKTEGGRVYARVN
jgi:hypothetical protein